MSEKMSPTNMDVEVANQHPDFAHAQLGYGGLAVCMTLPNEIGEPVSLRVLPDISFQYNLGREYLPGRHGRTGLIGFQSTDRRVSEMRRPWIETGRGDQFEHPTPFVFGHRINERDCHLSNLGGPFQVLEKTDGQIIESHMAPLTVFQPDGKDAPDIVTVMPSNTWQAVSKNGKLPVAFSQAVELAYAFHLSGGPDSQHPSQARLVFGEPIDPNQPSEIIRILQMLSMQYGEQKTMRIIHPTSIGGVFTPELIVLHQALLRETGLQPNELQRLSVSI